MKGNINNRHSAYILAFSLAILFFCTPDLFAGNPKADTLRQKLTEISSLRDEITAKKVQAIKMRCQLEARVKEYENEIQTKQRYSRILSYQDAIRYPRIVNNLKLLSELNAYISRFDEKIAYFQLTTENLEFLFQEADDNLRIVETLNDIQIRQLMDRLHEALAKYSPDAKRPLINLNNMVMTDPETIWNRITKKKH